MAEQGYQGIINGLATNAQLLAAIQQAIKALALAVQALAATPTGLVVANPIFLAGKPAAGAIVRTAYTFLTRYPNDFTGAVGIAGTASTGTATIAINLIDTFGASTPIGTCVFTAATQATFTSTGVTLVAVGQMIEFVFPNPADATLADVAITLAGSRM